jgi:ElaB/YqjD/DUF883 family membrane-anchored ribosome-binding protein
MPRKSTTARKAEALIDQLEGMVEEAGDLMKETTEDTVKKQLSNFKDKMQDLNDRLKNYYDDVEDAIVTGAKTTDKVIRNNPYEALAISLAIGVLLGAFIKSR